VASEKAKLEAALKTVQILEAFTATTTQPATVESLPLVVSRGGRVMEVTAQPGEAIESGQPILRVAQLDRLLARISLPAGESLATAVTRAHVLVPGHETTPLKAAQVGVAPTADALTGGQTFLFAVEAADFLLQPGMAVTAHLELPGEPQQGVVIPRSAVVRFGGSTWVYVRSAEEKFIRRQVPVDVPTPEGWFVAERLKSGEPVVVRGAQSVLSEELRFGTAEEEE
jgi:multidrug efflux pump subunit AcrA (membrane-fusion protein)